MEWRLRCFSSTLAEKKLFDFFYLSLASETFISSPQPTKALTVNLTKSMVIKSMFLCFSKNIVVENDLTFTLFVVYI